MKDRKRLVIGAAMALGIQASVANGVKAALVNSDVITVYDSAGAVMRQLAAPESEPPNETYIINVDPDVWANPGQFGNYTTLLEQDGSISDYFGVALVGGIYYLAFSSDPAPTAFYFGTSGHVTVLNEQSAPFDMAQYLAVSLRDQGWTATFQSDIDVPEPPAIAIFCVGSLGLIGCHIRRRASTAEAGLVAQPKAPKPAAA